MTPTVDVCNLALSLIGQSANISSFSPPEGSVHAQLCAAMYPLALGGLLERHPWAFATQRATLAQLATAPDGFAYAYALPADALRVWELRETADAPLADYELVAQGGVRVLVTNIPAALVLYTFALDIPQVYPPMFKLALAHALAALIAGPIIKGEGGAAVAKAMTQLAQQYTAQAAASDAYQKRETQVHTPVWIAGRA